MELKFRHDSDENRRNEFDLTKYVKLVPQFNESDVDKYFQHFEKIAKNLHWPENVWSTLLQSALKGKAQETFAALSVDDFSDYDVVQDRRWNADKPSAALDPYIPTWITTSPANHRPANFFFFFTFKGNCEKWCNLGSNWWASTSNFKFPFSDSFKYK